MLRLLLLLTSCVLFVGALNAQVRIVSPNANDVLIVGQTVQIRWTGVSARDTISIDYRTNDLAPWHNITPGAIGLTYNWIVTDDAVSDNVRLRITAKTRVDSSGTRVRILAGGYGRTSFTSVFSHDNSRLYTVGEAGIVKELDAFTGELLREWWGSYVDPVICISSDDRLLAFSGDKKLTILNLLDGTTTVMNVGAPVKSIDFDANGYKVAVATESLHAYVFNVTDTIPIQDLAHPNYVNSAEFSPDGSAVLTACTDKIARIWNYTDSVVVHEFKPHEINNFSARYSPDGMRVVTTGNELFAYVWNANTGELIHPIQHEDIVTYAEFSPDGLQIATACKDNTGYVFSSESYQRLFKLQPHTADVDLVTYSPQGNAICTRTTSSKFSVFNSTNGQLIFPVAIPRAALTSVVFSSDGRIATTAQDAGVRVNNVLGDDHPPLFTVMGHAEMGAGYQGRVIRASFMPDGQSVVSASEDGTVRNWHSAFGTQNFSSEPVPYSFEWVDVNIQSGLVVGTHNYGAQIFDQTGALRGEFSTDAEQHQLMRSRFSPDGRYVVVLPVMSNTDSTINVIRGSSGNLMYGITRFGEQTVDAVFSNDSQWLATISAEGNLRVHHAATGEQERQLVLGNISPLELLFSPNGKMLAVVGNNYAVLIVDVQTWQLSDTIQLLYPSKKAAWSPDSKHFAVNSIDRCDIFEVETTMPITHVVFESHHSNKSDVTFSPDGKLLATMDSHVDVFDAQTFQQLHHLQGRNSMEHIQWASDSKRVLVVSLHHQPWVWELQPASTIQDTSETTFAIRFDTTASSVAEFDRGQILIYPNPVGSQLNIELGTQNAEQRVENGEWRVESALGRVVSDGVMSGENRVVIDVSKLEAGMYVLRVGTIARMFVKL